MPNFALVDVALIALGYLSGSLPMGVIVARLTGAPDPRTVGSGRTGGTNALRAMGARRAVLVATLDVLKGALPVATAVLLGLGALSVALVGIAAVLGAWASVFLRFHGGRGVATAIGATAIIQPLAILIAAPVFFGLILLTRYVSLGSLLGVAAGVLVFAFFVWIGWNEPPALLFAIVAASLVWIAHRDNIDRLIKGRERKFSPLARGDD
ncbi:MAG TPA: glycerol-3-phosphate 1-O-acyltransferase PlsY [Candidatus Limnocylindrales bacterium]|nr:glycerol-3-phosphate 1-O-acyltransferase PlsY [Candidatus Limnocylindrales bacterium]